MLSRPAGFSLTFNNWFRSCETRHDGSLTAFGKDIYNLIKLLNRADSIAALSSSKRNDRIITVKLTHNQINQLFK